MDTSTRPYGAGFLDAQRKQLEKRRGELQAQIDQVAEETVGWQDADDNVDQHPGDDATATQEMGLGLGLLANAEAQLAAVEEALQRVDDGTYGWDEDAGEWIPEERLAALPWAVRTIESQRRLEQRFDADDRGYTHDDETTTL